MSHRNWRRYAGPPNHQERNIFTYGNGTLSVRRLAAVTATALLLVVGSASPAPAHFTGSNIYWQGVLRGYGQIVAAHNWAYACDRYADGHRVYTEFTYSSGGSGRVYDSTTSSNCTGGPIVGSITRYKVCVEVSFAVDPCTSWYRS